MRHLRPRICYPRSPFPHKWPSTLVSPCDCEFENVVSLLTFKNVLNKLFVSSSKHLKRGDSYLKFLCNLPLLDSPYLPKKHSVPLKCSPLRVLGCLKFYRKLSYLFSDLFPRLLITFYFSNINLVYLCKNLNVVNNFGF